MATKVEQRSYEEALSWLREHGFDLIEAPGTQGRVFLKKYSVSAAIQKDGDDGVKIFAYPGYLIGSEISKLVNRGYQQFLKTAKTEVPARLVQVDWAGTSCVIRMHEMNMSVFLMRRAGGVASRRQASPAGVLILISPFREKSRQCSRYS